MSAAADQPWFAGAEGDFLAFRVNRRPLRDGGSLFTTGELPSDPFEHFVAVLAPGHEVVTGRRNQRTWRVGGLAVDAEARTVTGKLGWVPRGEEVVTVWSDETEDWVSTAVERRGGRVIPFGFDGDTRLLTVLAEGSPPTTIAHVIETILRDQERQLLERTTEWSVEPILDAEDFVSWLRTVDVVRSVSFTAKLPNPEPLDAFEDLAARMRDRRATLYRENMRSDTDEGLRAIEDDRDFRQAIAMGEQGFAKLRGQAIRDGAVVRYSQSDTVARYHIDQLPADWETVRKLVVRVLREQLARLLADEDGRRA